MRKYKKNTDPLKKLVKDHGAISPSAGFSKRLLNVVLTQYRLSYSQAYRKQERLGKGIIAVLIASAVLIFAELRPTLEVLEMIAPVLLLAIGLFSLILMFKMLFSSPG